MQEDDGIVSTDLDRPGIAHLGATILAHLGLTPPPDYRQSLVVLRAS